MVDDQYELPATDLPVDVTIRDDRGDLVQQRIVTPNEHGTVHGQVALAPDAVTGFYYVEARIQLSEDNAANGGAYGGVGFQVASYRKPEFEIAVVTDKAEYVQDEAIAVEVAAIISAAGHWPTRP